MFFLPSKIPYCSRYPLFLFCFSILLFFLLKEIVFIDPFRRDSSFGNSFTTYCSSSVVTFVHPRFTRSSPLSFTCPDLNCSSNQKKDLFFLPVIPTLYTSFFLFLSLSLPSHLVNPGISVTFL